MIKHPLFQNLPGLRLTLHHPTNPSLLQRDYPRGTSTVTKPSQASPKRSEDRLVEAQDLAAFKSDMTTLIKDMIQSSLSNFASHFKSDSGGKGEASQDHETSGDREPSPDRVDPSEGEEGELASEEEDPKLDQGDPNLD